MLSLEDRRRACGRGLPYQTRAIEARPSLDALACFAILMRLAAEVGESSRAPEFGRSLCRVLLVYAPVLMMLGIARPLAEYIDEVVLPIGCHEGLRVSFGPMGYLRAAARLQAAAHAVEQQEGRELSNLSRARLRLDLLDDRFTPSLGDVTVYKATCCKAAVAQQA